MATARSHRSSKPPRPQSATSALTAPAPTTEAPDYTWLPAAALRRYRETLERHSAEQEYGWLRADLELWARWHAGQSSYSTASAFAAYRDHSVPASTAVDWNGTAFENRMLSIEVAYGRLNARAPMLARAIHCYYRRDMGRRAAAEACGLSEPGFDKRLNLALHFLAEFLSGRR